MLGIDFSGFVMLAVLAFFIHVISPNKYIGYFGFIAFLIANAFVWRPLRIATNMVQFAGPRIWSTRISTATNRSSPDSCGSHCIGAFSACC